MELEITKYMYDKIKTFADERVKGSKHLYRYRGTGKEDKIRDDIIIGAVGEYGAYRLLRQRGVECTKPDFTLHRPGKKSFGADLRAGKYHFHVKSQGQSSIEKYNSSYLFQRRDSLVTKPIPDEYLVLTQVDGRKVRLNGVYRAVDVIDYYDECKVPFFRATKVALYVEDLVNLKNDYFLL